MNLPAIGMGTFGSDRYDAATVAKAVEEALDVGYKLFDCASVYGNEDMIGEVFARAFAKGVKRDEIYVMSKVWNDSHANGKVKESCVKTLRDLRLEYLDVYFMHWPFPNTHAIGCDGDSRNKQSRPFFADEFMSVWRQMEDLKREGYVKEIAMSNMTEAKLKAVLPLCKEKPFALESELHPTFAQSKLRKMCEEKGIVNIGYCPLGSPNRPERDRTPEDIADTGIKPVLDIASARGISPAQACIAWAVNNGIIPIPFSSKRCNLASNLRAASLKLSEEELEILNGADRGNRLIKGQVFLWEGSCDWHDLWDEDGRLATWKKSAQGWQKI